MTKNLNLNILQDYIDMFGGRFKVKIKWHKGNMFIEQDEVKKGGVIYFTQIPLSANIELEMKEAILDNMPGVSKVVINDSVEVTQEVTTPHMIDLQNKFNQSMDFELELNRKKPATIEAYTYFGIHRLVHDYTYVRALFTTNPYFAVIFNGVRIVPYDHDLGNIGKEVIKTIQQFAQEKLTVGDNLTAEIQFKVEKAFEITFYFNKENVTAEIHRLMTENQAIRTTLDEFGFVAYIALYQQFNGELNNSVPLSTL